MFNKTPNGILTQANAVNNNNNEEEPKYTIEQIELLRRLRNSGLTKAQIIQALDCMERIDSSGFSIPVETSSAETKHHENQPMHLPLLGGTASDYLRNLALQQAIAVAAMTNNSLMNGTVSANGSMKNQITSLTNQQTAALAALSNQNGAFQHNGFPNTTSTTATFGSAEPSANTPTLNGQSVFVKREPVSNISLGDPTSVKDEDSELLHMQSMSVVDTKEEIKNFMMSHGIKQHQVAEKTGVSQSYISQFLHQGVWMKDSTRTNIYKWYLDEKRRRDANGDFGTFSSSISRGNSPTDVNSISQNHIMTSTNNTFGCLAQSPTQSGVDKISPGNTPTLPGQPVKKRDRFVWKESCVQLLEKFYINNPYPDDGKREEIATACNQLNDANSPNGGQDEKIVTAVKVYNWFANRRKEVKRKHAFVENASSWANQHYLSNISHSQSTSEENAPLTPFVNTPTTNTQCLSPTLPNQTTNNTQIPNDSQSSIECNKSEDDAAAEPCGKTAKQDETLLEELAAVDHSISALLPPESPGSEILDFAV